MSSSGGQGWGQAPPFAVMPAGNDHPLATSYSDYPLANPPLPPPPPLPNVAPATTNTTQQQQFSRSTSRSVTTTTAAAAPVSAPPPSLQTIQRSRSSSMTLDALADEFLSQPSYRTQQLGLDPILRPDPLPANEEGVDRLRTLVERRAWGDVLKLATTLLTTGSSPYSGVYASLLITSSVPDENSSNIPIKQRQETVEIMILQCHAWLKLRRYTDLVTEVERWNFCVQNDATAQSPDWLPWSIHILAGMVQEYIDDSPANSTDILYQLRDRIPSTEYRWLCNVDHALSNIFLKRGDFRRAMACLDRILQLLPQAVPLEVAELYSNTKTNNDTFDDDTEGLTLLLVKAYTCEIYSRQGRILLQAGALLEAAEIFESAKVLWTEVEISIPQLPDDISIIVSHKDLVQLLPCQMEVNEALFYFSKSHYDHALESFTKAVELLRKSNNFRPKYRTVDWVGPSIAGCTPANTLYNESVNNMAITHLYMCDMSNAIGLLEGVVREDPTAFLTERVAFNLCTLYELGSDNPVGVRRKKTLNLIAKRFFLHDIGTESFRLS
ncbi:tetratricopeptide repeat protein [Nitzschia inconspicua]|uniref:Tetratricopeptide repeat protein n=2 Tax=Nitzschia inconspicua TaxID=303405 RepID=A0A9K3KNA7_9STRA|nr:tetratricopeptide repeat protein [Nitzschia inconspicua]